MFIDLNRNHYDLNYNIKKIGEQGEFFNGGDLWRKPAIYNGGLPGHTIKYDRVRNY